MIFKFRSILLFAGTILALTWLIFPGPTTLTDLFWRSGQPEQAREALERGLRKKNPGTELLLQSVDVHLAHGETDKAVEALRTVVARRPRNAGALERLAKILEWTMHPVESLEIYERLLALKPERSDVRSRLIHGHLYYGNTEKAVDFMAEDIMSKGNTAPVGDSVALGLRSLLLTLSRERSGQGPKPLLDHALSSNYLLLEQYRRTERTEPDRHAFTIYALENCLAAGRPDLAATFARDLDDMAFAPDGTLALARVMTWNSMPDPALETVLDGLARFPGSDPLLEQAIFLARTSPNRSLADAVATRLEESGRTDLLEQAVQLKIADGQLVAALNLSKRLEKEARNRVEEKLLLAALAEEDPASLVQLTQSIEEDGASVSLTRSMAAAHARLGDSEKARELWHRTLPSPAAGPEVWAVLLDSAVAGRDPEIIRDTLSALPHAGSPELTLSLRNAARELAAAEQYEPAVTALRRALPPSPASEDLKTLLLWAGYSRNSGLVESASELVRRHGMNNPELVRLAGEVNGWIGAGAGALPFAVRRLQTAPCDRQAAQQALAVASAAALPAARVILTCPSLTPREAVPALALLDRYGQKSEVRTYLAGKTASSRPERDRLRWLTAAEELGFQDLAYTGYAALFREFPNRPSYGREAARLASWTQRYRERGDILTRLAERNPNNAEAAVRAARALEEAEQPQRALPHYLRALSLAPSTPNLRPHVLRLLGELGMYAERFQLLADQRGERPLSRREVRLFLRDALLLNRASQVVQEAEALALSPDTDPYDLILTARILNRAGHIPRARRILTRARREASGSLQMLQALGTVALNNNFLDEALACFREVLNRLPSDGAALKGSAMIHAANSDPQRAIRFFRRYLALYPDDAGARYQLGELLFVNGRQDEAHMEYARAVRVLKSTPPSR